MDSHPDIIYRVQTAASKPTYCTHGYINTAWHGKYSSIGGKRGCFTDVDVARKSIAQYMPGTKYEIWKFHVGKVDSDIPYFPPEKVFEKL